LTYKIHQKNGLYFPHTTEIIIIIIIIIINHASKHGTVETPFQHLSRLKLLKGDNNKMFHIMPVR